MVKGVDIVGGGQPIILLHSSLSSRKQWLPLVKKLANNYLCINLDILGYGDAEQVEHANQYTINTEVERILTCLSEHGVKEQHFHLIGHSYGGAIALALAQRVPQQLVSLSLFEPVAFHLLKQSNADAYHFVEQFSAQLKNASPAEAAQQFVDFWNGQGFFSSLPTKVQTEMEHAMQKVHLDFQGILSARYQLACLSDIKCPSLILAGQQTQNISTTLSCAIANNLTNVTYKTTTGGHMAPISHSEEVTSLIEAFVLEHKKAR